MPSQIMSGVRSNVAIKLPFNVTPQGTIEDTSDFRQIWADRVRAVLLTSKYERVNNPDFGSSIYDELLNGGVAKGGAKERVVAAIYEAFSTFLTPALTIQDVSVDFDTSVGILDVSVTYKLPDNTSATTTLNSLSISGDKPPVVETQSYAKGAQ